MVGAGVGGMVGAAAGVQLATSRRNKKTIQIDFRIIFTAVLKMVMPL
jgi:gas vesicle protein